MLSSTFLPHTISLSPGEFIAVMNGVEFRTRHNDYKFRQPAHSKDFEAIEEIPFPAVPPEVLSKNTLQVRITGL